MSGMQIAVRIVLTVTAILLLLALLGVVAACDAVHEARAMGEPGTHEWRRLDGPPGSAT